MKRLIFMLLTVVMLFGSTVTAFAMEYPQELPPIPNGIGEHQKAIIVELAGEVMLWEYSNDDQFKFADMKFTARYTDTGKIEINAYMPNSQDIFRYKLSADGTRWDDTTGIYMNIGTKTLAGTATRIIYTTHDVEDADTGEVFFPQPPVPLAEEIRGVAEETLTAETMPGLNQTVLVVVLCGVGCLALVISLPLLKKVLFRFLT